MDTHPNAAFAHAFWSAVAEGDGDELRKLLARDVHWISVGRNPLAGEFRGREPVIEYLARVGDFAPELVSELRSVFASDEGAVLWHNVRARHDGRQLEMEFLLLLELFDGQLTRVVSVAVDPYTNDEFWRP